MTERDMMYGGYCQSMPGNMMYGNFGYQGMPGSLMPMQNNLIPNNPYINNNSMITSSYDELNSRLNNLENRIKILEQRLSNNSYQDDNSLYML